MEGKRNENQDTISFSFFFCIIESIEVHLQEEFPNEMNAIETLLTNTEVVIGQEELGKRNFSRQETQGQVWRRPDQTRSNARTHGSP